VILLSVTSIAYKECPSCGKEAVIKHSIKNKPYLWCSGCGLLILARLRNAENWIYKGIYKKGEK
jgi:DNA-directed RNA polymerase subunit RPC12/RpoP